MVEDEPNIRELVCLHLTLEGYACESVGDGRTALTRSETERFDLLVLDVMIPGIDGLTLCRAVRNGSGREFGRSSGARAIRRQAGRAERRPAPARPGC